MSQLTSGTDRAHHVVIAVLAGLNAVGAAGGALGLAFGFLRLDTVSASRLPWGSTVLAGIALTLLVQVGCRRAGFYSNDLIDNLGQPSARSIVPGLQKLERGQYVPMSPSPTPDTAFTVASYLVPDLLLCSKCDSTWAWQLSANGSGGTRLVTRIRAVSYQDSGGLGLAPARTGADRTRSDGVR
jgi:hypothetical protein